MTPSFCYTQSYLTSVINYKKVVSFPTTREIQMLNFKSSMHFDSICPAIETIQNSLVIPTFPGTIRNLFVATYPMHLSPTIMDSLLPLSVVPFPGI